MSQVSVSRNNATIWESLTHLPKHFKIALFMSLLIHAHNRYISWKTSESCHPNWKENQTDILDHPFLFIIYCLDSNLLLYIVLGMLFYNQMRVRGGIRTELLNLGMQVNAKSNISDEIEQFALTDPEQTDDTRGTFVCSQHDPKDGISSSGSKQKTDPMGGVNVDDCIKKIKQGLGDDLTDAELLHLLAIGKLKTRELESVIGNLTRAVEMRRQNLADLMSRPHVLDRLPFHHYDYRWVYGQCCEEVIGYVPIPVGKIGPLLLDGHSHYLPLATTEGCLVASTNRGCRALFLAGGVTSVVFRDQMTRAPVVWFPTVIQVIECMAWIESALGFQTLKSAFDRTSSHVDMISIFPNPAGRYLHLRFAARTGDAMGMNMVSKATDSALHELQHQFPHMQIISLSGNMCTDKKAAAINSILGRGKSVIAEARLPSSVVNEVLHTTPTRLARLAHAKNGTGSAMAGCLGMSGANAHAANIVAGMFAATGQDLAQVVDACACLTQLEVDSDGSLLASVTMPCIEVGTIGGGTRLPAQRACLDMLDLNVDRPTEHLARLIASAVLAGELSLMAALDTDDLVSAHLRFNRARTISRSGTKSTKSVDVDGLCTKISPQTAFGIM